ncbi:MAG: T9SS type A sorting domain-containing protein [Bacteroidales bacterium]|nr:T9SS type A sorting domain-containing protein [Bacteroidales bacterium]
MRKLSLIVLGILLTTSSIGQNYHKKELRIQDIKKVLMSRTELIEGEGFYKKMDSVVEKEPDNYGVFIYNYKEEFYYDDNGNNTSDYYYEWNGAYNRWDPSSKGVYDFDIDNNMVSLLWLDWSSNVNDWEAFMKADFFNDINGNTDSLFLYFWENNDWVKEDRIDYEYNVNGTKTAEIWSGWDETNSEWFKDNKEEYILDINENCTTFINYDWNDANSEWEYSNKTEISLDEHGHSTLEEEYNWEEGSWFLEEKSENEYTYDVDGNILVNISYDDWNESSSTWEGQRKSDYTYDTIGSVSMLYMSNMQFNPIYFEHGIPMVSNGYRWDNNQWNHNDTDKYYYTIIDGPDVNITTDTLYPGDSEFDITITFSEQISGFEEDDITVTNGVVKATSLTTSDSIVFIGTITPASSDEIITAIPEYVAKDLDGNYNNDAYLTVNKAASAGIHILPDIQFNIYPNPSKGVVYININDDSIGSKIEIYNLLGSVVYDGFIRESDGSINLGNLPKGLYIIKIGVNYNAVSKKLIIE